MKSSMVLKQFKLNIPILLLSEIYWNKGNNCCLLILSKSLNVGMLSDIYRWI